MNMRTGIRQKLYQLPIYVIISLFSAFCLLPFIMVISGSLSLERDIMEYGYRLIPKNISFLSYKMLMLRAHLLIDAYKVSIVVTAIGTLISVLINSMVAYTLSRKTLKFRKFISVYCLITILFSGGMVPWYIVCVNYLHLKDSIPALILPYVANGWYIFLLRNFLQAIPDEMHESAKMDGASEIRTFIQIILPLAKPAVATISLFTALTYWNDWWLALMLIDNDKLRPVQYLLRVIISNVSFMQSQMKFSEFQNSATLAPTEGVKMATCIVTIGPIVFLYPFLQRFFVKGIMVGAVKG